MLSRILFAIVLLSPYQKMEIDSRRHFIVWNVRQGLWLTAVSESQCSHFDMGGSRKSLPSIRQRVLKICGGKKNQVHFSHWDLDHIGLARHIYRFLPFCVASWPRGIAKVRQKKLLAALPSCRQRRKQELSIAEMAFTPPQNGSANQNSRVFLLENKFLLPGDSPADQEIHWLQQKNLGAAKILILGHHGSNTSTCSLLLERLSAVKVAVASSFFKKYGHPHQNVCARVKSHGISLLRTEEWGNIYFDF